MKHLQRVKAHIQRFMRWVLGLPSDEDLWQVINGLFVGQERDLAALRADAELKIDELHAIRLHVQAELSALRVTEQNIKAHFAELSKAEAEMQRVAGDMTLALYDAVEKIMAEIAEAKKAVEGEQSSDK